MLFRSSTNGSLPGNRPTVGVPLDSERSADDPSADTGPVASLVVVFGDGVATVEVARVDVVVVAIVASVPSTLTGVEPPHETSIEQAEANPTSLELHLMTARYRRVR